MPESQAESAQPIRWRKKPVEIEAMRFDGDNGEAIRQWMYRHVQQVGHPSVWFSDGPSKWGLNVIPEGMDAAVYDYLHRTWVGVEVGSWIIHGVQGEFYPIKDDVLRATYDLSNPPGTTIDHTEGES